MWRKQIGSNNYKQKFNEKCEQKILVNKCYSDNTWKQTLTEHSNPKVWITTTTLYICYKLWLCCPSQLDGVQVKYDMFLAAFNPTTLLCLRRLGPILLPYHCKTTAKLFIIDERFQQQSPGPMFPVIIGFVVRCSVATRKPECKDIQALAILSKSITSTRDCLTCL